MSYMNPVDPEKPADPEAAGTPEPTEPPEGDLVDGRYSIRRRIADGGMATVYEAQDVRLDRTVALKVMHTRLAQGPNREAFMRHFRREAQSAARIANPHIVQVYDFGQWHGLDFLVMEYVDGCNLRHVLHERGRFTVDQTLHVIGETLDGLTAAHGQGVVHRDIKPENILINTRGHVQITDFGLAKAASQTTMATTGMLLGTAAYLAPEMIESNLATPQGDLYSVGIMAWELLCGVVPFDCDNSMTMVFKHVNEDVPDVASIYPDVPAPVNDFIRHLTMRDMERRPADAAAALAEFEQMRESLSAEQLGWRAQEAPSPEALAGTTKLGQVAQRARIASPIGATGSDADNADNAAGTDAAEGNGIGGADTAGSANPTGRANTAADTASTASTASTDSATAHDASVDDADATVPLATTTVPIMRDDGMNATALLPQDDLPTMAIRDDASDSATAPANTLETTPATPPLPPATPAHDRRHSARRLVVTVLLVLVLLAGCSAVWWFFSGPGSYRVLPAAQDVPCDASTASCTLTNANWDNYRALLDDEGIAYQVTERNDDSVPAGSIISTSPSLVGSHVSIRGGIVDVVVSQGAVQLTVPSDLLDASTADGKDPLAALAATGFTNVQHDESADQYSLTVPQGAAISVTPAPGSTVDHNTTVTVVLSKGLKPITFPDVVGKTRTEAESTLAPDNLTITWKQEYSDSVEEGTVISASAAAGDALHWGDSVTITVSKGPQMATVPDVVGSSYDDAEKTLTALGFKVEKKTTILGNWTDQVRQQSVDAGTSVRIHNTDGTPTVITLTVV
ncbi:serine/threonine-protein kinase [Pseudoscardovia suis]|uniref:Serine/threonine protein kinase n=2 Tax=Pseudoscardovia suis TaxID=987063 RepID=A0A261ES49_9BIFI|nr:PASTA domain-containing protein [Pseudoscardovia suis]OZG49671.1 serine/threonine protein kinase [Pseudoscardovia suis]PJJ69790.1 serine/threonine-protein kinase [Pseudoscardovia suis]